jgi:hypothetical protein
VTPYRPARRISSRIPKAAVPVSGCYTRRPADRPNLALMATLPLRAALRHGVLVATANWPLVLIHFVLQSVYRLGLSVPILGGAVMVAAIVGAEPASMVGDGLQGTADLVIGALATAPLALMSFFVALAVVGIGGQAVVFALGIGALTVVVRSERRVADLEQLPFDGESLRAASAFDLETVYAGVAHFGRRALVVAAWLGGFYLVVGAIYLAVLVFGLTIAVRWSWVPAWPLLVFLSTAVGVVAISAVNLASDILQVIIVTDDCSVGTAARRLRRFVIEDSRQVVGIFGVMGVLVIVATALSVFAAAGLAVAAWMPFISLVVVPLQAAAWLVRGLVFQYVELSALAAYQTQYRRFAHDRRVHAATA